MPALALILLVVLAVLLVYALCGASGQAERAAEEMFSPQYDSYERRALGLPALEDDATVDL